MVFRLPRESIAALYVESNMTHLLSRRWEVGESILGLENWWLSSCWGYRWWELEEHCFESFPGKRKISGEVMSQWQKRRLQKTEEKMSLRKVACIRTLHQWRKFYMGPVVDTWFIPTGSLLVWQVIQEKVSFSFGIVSFLPCSFSK